MAEQNLPDSELELAKSRCLALRHRLVGAPNIHQPATRSILRLVDAELRFLSRLSPTSPLSSNLSHLDAVHHVITHPSTRSVSRVASHVGPAAHVDVVLTFRSSPAWALVSGRNPSHLSWAPPASGGRDRGLRARVAAVVAAARVCSAAARPEKVLVVFARGVRGDVSERLADEFGAVEIDFVEDFAVFEDLEDGWVGVRIEDNEELKNYRVFEVSIVADSGEKLLALPSLKSDGEELDLNGRFGSLVSKLRSDSRDLVNFDTTALIAIISGTSNGGARRLLDAPEADTRARFKGNYEFVIAQALSELKSPLLLKFEKMVAGKNGIICGSVSSEFKELVSTCGGPDEKIRASQLVKRLVLVPDSPSVRMMDLPTTRKLAMKNKVVFGTGDHWHAPTLTANMGFVRAVSQAGMSLLTMEHRPCALIGL